MDSEEENNFSDNEFENNYVLDDRLNNSYDKLDSLKENIDNNIPSANINTSENTDSYQSKNKKRKTKNSVKNIELDDEYNEIDISAYPTKEKNEKNNNRNFIDAVSYCKNYFMNVINHIIFVQLFLFGFILHMIKMDKKGFKLLNTAIITLIHTVGIGNKNNCGNCLN